MKLSGRPSRYGIGTILELMKNRLSPKNRAYNLLGEHRSRSLGVVMLLGLLLFPSVRLLQAAEPTVYLISIRGTIDYGTLQYVNRSYQEANEANSDLILMEIDTPGGLVDAAVKVSAVMRDSKAPTAAYVTGGAISAGSLLALTAPELFMAPGSTIGAAEPRLGSEKADEKILSYWRTQLAEAAELNGRDPTVAAAMADADIEIPGVIAKGKLLTLTSKQALELGMIDGVLPDRSAVLAHLGLAEAQQVKQDQQLAENMLGWFINPTVSTLLLMLGIAGLAIEIFTVGFGVAGSLGILALAMYFGSHLLVGLTGWFSILVFIIGLILLAIEALALPGFGVTGIAGIGALVASIVMTAPSVEQAIISMVLALIGTIMLLFLSLRFLPTRNTWRRLVLASRQTNNEGYTAPRQDLSNLLGQEGMALTPLHPAGAAEIGGQRVDVVTEGEYIAKGTHLRVIRVEGTRVVVGKVK